MISKFQATLEVTVICLLVMFYFLFVQGCGVAGFSASTTATYQITPDGKFISYTSNKEQQGLDLELEEKDGKPVVVKIHVDKASTSERAIAAALELNQKLVGVLEKLMPLLEKGAMAGS